MPNPSPRKLVTLEWGRHGVPFWVSIKYILHWNHCEGKCSVSRVDRCIPSLRLRRASQKATGFHSLTLLIARHYNLLLSQSKLFTPLSSVVDGVVRVELGLNHHYRLPARFCAPSDKTAFIRDSCVPPFLHHYQILRMEKSWGTANLHKRVISVRSVCPAQSCLPGLLLTTSGIKW